MIGIARRCAFTLIEILIVIILLALVAGIAVPGLGRVCHSDPLKIAETALRRSGAVLRQQAGQRGGTTLDLTQQGWSVASVPGIDLELDEGVTCAWHDATGASIDRLWIDAHGLSLDCAVDLMAEGRRDTWRWLGLSGVWIRVEEPTP